MADELERRVAEQMGDVAPGAGVEVVDAQHLMALADQPLAQMRAQETRAAGHKHPLLLEIAPAHRGCR